MTNTLAYNGAESFTVVKKFSNAAKWLKPKMMMMKRIFWLFIDLTKMCERAVTSHRRQMLELTDGWLT